MKILKDILNKKNIGKNTAIDEKSIESLFFETLQKEFSNIGRADIFNFKLKDKKIFLRTAHPAIAGEIWKKREKLKEGINSLLESEIIKEIKVK